MNKETQEEIMQALKIFHAACTKQRIEVVILMDRKEFGEEAVLSAVCGKSEELIIQLLARGTANVMGKLAEITAMEDLIKEAKQKDNSKDELDGYNFSLN